MVRSDGINSLSVGVHKLAVAVERYSLSLVAQGMIDVTTLPWYTPSYVPGDSIKLSKNLCRNEAKECNIENASHDDTTFGAHKTEDDNFNRYESDELQAHVMNLELGGCLIGANGGKQIGRNKMCDVVKNISPHFASEAVAHHAFDEMSQARVYPTDEFHGVSGRMVRDNIIDEVLLLNARNMFDRMPVPEFLSEMAQVVQGESLPDSLILVLDKDQRKLESCILEEWVVLPKAYQACDVLSTPNSETTSIPSMEELQVSAAHNMLHEALVQIRSEDMLQLTTPVIKEHDNHIHFKHYDLSSPYVCQPKDTNDSILCHNFLANVMLVGVYEVSSDVPPLKIDIGFSGSTPPTPFFVSMLLWAVCCCYEKGKLDSKEHGLGSASLVSKPRQWTRIPGLQVRIYPYYLSTTIVMRNFIENTLLRWLLRESATTWKHVLCHVHDETGYRIMFSNIQTEWKPLVNYKWILSWGNLWVRLIRMGGFENTFELPSIHKCYIICRALTYDHGEHSHTNQLISLYKFHALSKDFIGERLQIRSPLFMVHTLVYARRGARTGEVYYLIILALLVDKMRHLNVCDLVHYVFDEKLTTKKLNIQFQMLHGLTLSKFFDPGRRMTILMFFKLTLEDKGVFRGWESMAIAECLLVLACTVFSHKRQLTSEYLYIIESREGILTLCWVFDPGIGVIIPVFSLGLCKPGFSCSLTLADKGVFKEVGMDNVGRLLLGLAISSWMVICTNVFGIALRYVPFERGGYVVYHFEACAHCIATYLAGATFAGFWRSRLHDVASTTQMEAATICHTLHYFTGMKQWVASKVTCFHLDIEGAQVFDLGGLRKHNWSESENLGVCLIWWYCCSRDEYSYISTWFLSSERHFDGIMIGLSVSDLAFFRDEDNMEDIILVFDPGGMCIFICQYLTLDRPLQITRLRPKRQSCLHHATLFSIMQGSRFDP